ncbi:MAG: TonB-dependent receptor [Acidobacteria bacterium]|nr:TonB-dependent receptor [Acidobacteriota bacterium]
MGGDFRRTDNDVFYTGANSSHSFSNRYSLDNFADFLLGLPASISKTTFVRPYGGGMYYFGGYLQDDWKVTKRLTVNLGIRYEVETPLVGQNGDFPSFDHQKGQVVFQQNVGTRPEIEQFYGTIRPDIRIRFDPYTTPYDADRNNWAPRVGFAYQLHPRMVLRGGFGVFYSGPQVAWISSANDFAPNSLRPIWTGDSIRPVLVLPNRQEIPTGYNPEGNGGPERTVAFPAPLTMFPLYGRNFPYGFTSQWLVSWQTQLTHTLMFEAQYLGSRTNHMLGYHNTNYSTTPSSAPIQPRLPYSSFARIQGAHMGLDGWYQGLGLKTEKRLSRGMSFLVSYTWSKSLDTGSTFEAAPVWTDPNNFWKSAKGPSAYDAAHRLVVSYSYDLPFGQGRTIGSGISRTANLLVGGWGVRGITFLQTGFPYDPTMNEPSEDQYLCRGLFGSRRSCGQWQPVEGRSHPERLIPRSERGLLGFQCFRPAQPCRSPDRECGPGRLARSRAQQLGPWRLQAVPVHRIETDGVSL